MTDTLAPVETITVSYQGSDYHVPHGPVDAEALRVLNPDAADDVIDHLLALPALTAAASGNTSLPLGERDESWDAGAAETAMGNNADQLAAYHFWVDPEGDATAKASYKLPFGTPEGTAHAVWAGVTAAAAAVQGSRGGVAIPDADVAGVKTKIEAFYTKAAAKYQDDTITPPWAASTAATVAEVPPVLPEERTAAGSWSAAPLIPYGEMTRDGRMIRAGALTWPDQLPVPLMAMLEDVHGPSMSIPPSQLAGSIDAFTASDAGLDASGQIDDTVAGQAALAAAADGRMGISADLAVSEYEFVMSQEAIDEWNQMVESGGEVAAEQQDTASQDVPGGVVVESGTADEMGVLVVTKGEVMGATIVPFAAFDRSRIEVTALHADGGVRRVRITAPITLTAAMPEPELAPVSLRDQLDMALKLRVATVNEARVALGLAPVEGGDVYLGQATAPAELDLPETDAPMIAALEAIAAQMKASSGAAAVETLVASMRRQNGQRDPDAVDLVALVKAVGESSRDPSLVAALEAITAHAGRPPEPVERTTVINPPPITVHTPDVKVENHQPNVEVVTAGAPRSLRVVRDDAGHAVRYEVADE